MKRTFFLALLFSCSGAMTVHVFATHAVITLQRQQRRSPHARKVSPKTVQAKPVVVREIDIAGLKQLLARDKTSTQTPARPLLVNFWATWCEPCREEFPDLVRINKDYKARGLEFIVVSLDDVEELNKGVPQFLQQMRATMPAYLLNAPDQEAAMNAVNPQWSGAMPATFLFSPHGQLIYSHTGRIEPAGLKQAIEFALKPENR